MDKIALADLHTSLKTEGYTGEEKTLETLLFNANKESQQRFFMSYWKSVGTPEQVKFFTSTLAHAKKHDMHVHFNAGTPDRLILASRRSDQAARLSTVDLSGNKVRLVFFQKSECIGERNIVLK